MQDGSLHFADCQNKCSHYQIFVNFICTDETSLKMKAFKMLKLFDGSKVMLEMDKRIQLRKALCQIQKGNIIHELRL